MTDPRNLGALLRSAECAGVTGVVLPRHRAAHLSPTVAKVAAGAIEHLRFAVVGGIPAALGRAGGPRGVDHRPGRRGRSGPSTTCRWATGPVALVVGGEEKGLAPLVRRRCDEVAAVPQHGSLPSLNVGVAGAVACFEVARQRGAARRRRLSRYAAGAPRCRRHSGGPRPECRSGTGGTPVGLGLFFG